MLLIVQNEASLGYAVILTINTTLFVFNINMDFTNDITLRNLV
jgi:hypothetical protein